MADHPAKAPSSDDFVRDYLEIRSAYQSADKDRKAEVLRKKIEEVRERNKAD